MDNEILKFLLQRDNYYLGQDKEIGIKEASEFSEDDLVLYNIEEIVFDEWEDRKKSIENILSSMKIEGINFLYLVLGDENGIKFYFGIVRDLYYDKEMKIGIDDIENYILKPNIKGNFFGSKITELDSDEKNKIQRFVNDMECFGVLEGSPGKKDDADNYINTLVKIMNRDKFGFAIISKPLSDDDIWNIENNLSELYTIISALSLNNVQEAVSQSSTSSIANSAGEAFTNAFNGSLYVQGTISENKGGNADTSLSESKGRAETAQSTNNTNKDRPSSKSVVVSDSNQEGTTIGQNWGKTIGKAITVVGGYTTSNITESSITEVKAATEGTTTATTIQTVNKEVQEWIKYIDDVLFPRLDYGKGKGLFNMSTFLFAKEMPILRKLEGAVRLLFIGKTGNKVPIKAIDINENSVKIEMYKKFQLPHGNFPENKGINNPLARAAITQYLDDEGNVILGNWVSSNELSFAMVLPDEEFADLNISEPRQLVVNVPSNIKRNEMEYLFKILKRLFEKK